MTGLSGLGTCGWVSWGVGVVAGLLAYWVSVGEVTWLPALLIGVSVAVFVALILGKYVCGWSMTGHDAEPGPPAAQSVASGAAEAGAAGATAMAAGVTSAARKAEDKAEDLADKAGDAAEEVAAQAAEAGEDAAGEAKRVTRAAVAKAGDVAEAVTGSRPAVLTGARDGKPDDLKQIKGIGPKLEKMCNELGFYHFDQIAGWTEAEVAWVDENLKGFKGRVSRDNWVEQARTLAAGGETEFSQRVGKGEVY